MTLQLSPPTAPGTAGRGCYAGVAGAFTYVVGDAERLSLVADGYDGVSVSCTRRGNSRGELEFDATISGTDQNGREPISFTSTGTALIDGSTMATITWFSPDIGHVDCPIIGAADDSTSGCKVHGTFAFVGCATN